MGRRGSSDRVNETRVNVSSRLGVSVDLRILGHHYSSLVVFCFVFFRKSLETGIYYTGVFEVRGFRGQGSEL